MCKIQQQSSKESNYFSGIEEFLNIPVGPIPNPPASLDLQGCNT